MKLKIKNLSKTYSNGVEALKNVNLDIPKGMFGLLGPNGAGKSTLMRIIATLQEPDEGSVYLGNINVLEEKYEVRKRLGYLPQEFGLYPKETAKSLLSHIAVLKGIENRKKRKNLVNSILNQTNLYKDKNKKLNSFSGGMKKRFGIAQALLGNPKLLIVDEPTAGLDPEERNHFLNLLSGIGEEIIVILSTHIVKDVKELCTQMAILNEGEILFRNSPASALKRLKGKVWKNKIKKKNLDKFKKNYNVISKKLFAGDLIIHVYSNELPDNSFEKVDPELEDAYFSTLYSHKNLKE